MIIMKILLILSKLTVEFIDLSLIHDHKITIDHRRLSHPIDLRTPSYFPLRLFHPH